MVQCDQRNDDEEEEQENECLSIGQIKQTSSYSSSLKTNKSDRRRREKKRLIAQEEKRFLSFRYLPIIFISRDIVNTVFVVRNCLNRWSLLLSKLIQMTLPNLIIGNKIHLIINSFQKKKKQEALHLLLF